MKKFEIDRRKFIKGAALASVALATPTWAAPATKSATLNACAPGGIDLVIQKKRVRVAGKLADVITINGSFPGPLIRMKEGEEAVIRVHNKLDESTSIHWHGILLPFTMDGVPGISFKGIPAGKKFTYRYKLRQHGTYWYHSHSGFQEQLGQYGALIVEPKDADPVAYDVEHSIVLSDWTFEDPEQIFHKLKKMEGYFNFQRLTLANLGDQMKQTGASLGETVKMRLNWDWMRMAPTDIADVTGATYSYLINGETASQNPVLVSPVGKRVRLRIVNASAMTFYDVRIPGVPMTVVSADGQDVKPVEVDELRIGVAETYDVIVTLSEDRAYTFFAETMDRSGFARATLAPRPGMSAPVPARRARPLLTMADMGMMHTMEGSKDGMKGMGSMKGMKHKKAAQASPKDSAPNAKSSSKLALMGLPDRIEHGPDKHGAGSITMAKAAHRRLDQPGNGLGSDKRRVLTYKQLKALSPPPDRRAPDREINMHLTGNMEKYIWGFDGKKWSESDILEFKYGERLRINFFNDTMMSHPMHLHGMWMDLYAGHAYGENPRKHTVRVQPSELLTVDITVDAPGRWAFHCHLLYHMEAGMFRTVGVVKSLSKEVKHARK